MAYIVFEKLENANVVVKNVIEGNTLLSLSPSQMIIADVNNDRNIIIKNSSDPNEKGFVFNYKDIDLNNCIPVIVSKERSEIIRELSENFFFELNDKGSKILYFENNALFPNPGEPETIYIDTINKTQYIWESTEGYRELKQNLDLDNCILSPTKFIKTFYVSLNSTSLESINIVFPKRNLTGNISVNVSESKDSYYKIENYFNISYDPAFLLIKQSKINKESIDVFSFTQFRIGNIELLEDSSDLITKPSIPIMFTSVRNYINVKIQVVCELAFDLINVFHELKLSSIYKGEKFLPVNYQSTGYIPRGTGFENTDIMTVEKTTGVLYRVPKPLGYLPFKKTIVCYETHPINSSYIGIDNKFMDIDTLSVVETSNNFLSKTLFSNTLFSTIENIKLKSAKIFSSYDNVRIEFVNIKTNVYADADHYSSMSLIKGFDLKKGWNNLVFDSLFYEASQSMNIAFKVISTVSLDRVIMLYGGISYIGY